MSEVGDQRPDGTAGTAKRVVSVVPSLTESLAATAGGLAALVGVTDWCTHPADLPAERIGGTKNPNVARIIELCPDVVVANEEENRAADLEQLRAAGICVHVTHIRCVADALTELPTMLQMCGVDPNPPWFQAANAQWAAGGVVDAMAPEQRTGVVIPIWRRPWMAVGSDTFTGDVLWRLGYDNVLADSPERYPKFTPTELPPVDLVVLPDEPYVFTADDGPEAFPDKPCALVSGRHLTWYGPSLAEAADALRAALRAPVDPA